MSHELVKTKITINIKPKTIPVAQVSLDEEFKDIVRTSFSLAEIARKVGVKSTREIKARLLELQDYEKAHLIGKKSALDLIPDNELKEMVSNAKSYNDLIVRLGYSVNVGTIVPSIKRKLIEKGISTDHFVGQATTLQRSKLSQRIRNRLLMESGNTCSICGLKDKWNDKPIKMQIDHINGIAHDHAATNLRTVCPNCHTQLETTGSRNKNHVAHRIVKKVECKKVALDNCEKCGKCGNPILTKDAKMCANCANLASQKVPRPPIDTIFADVKALNYVGTANKYGVSDNAIRKWFIFAGYNPPTHKDIKNNVLLEELKK